MFAPTLFGISPSQFWSLFRDLLTPTLGFMFLFLLGLPLKDIPFVKNLTDYHPPKYVLPVFALGSLLLSTFTLGSALFLHLWHENVDVSLFTNSFQIVRSLDMKSYDIAGADVRVFRYHELTNFNIIVNGYRIFGSDSNCAFEYQCVDTSNVEQSDIDRIDGDVKRLNSAIDNLPKPYGGPGFISVHYMRERFTLPHIESINYFLVKGENFVDIHAWNSGAGAGCVFGVTLELRSRSGSVDPFKIQIDPGAGNIPLQSDVLKESEIFYSGGETFLEEGRGMLMPYRTYQANHLHRICERIRIKLVLTEDQANSLGAEEAFRSWALNRNKNSLCTLLFRPYCEEIGPGNFVKK